jgi:pimeloyl-ACP methyl ester carboxylesterase
MGNAIALLFSQVIRSQIRSIACIEGNLIGADCGLLSRGIADTPYQNYANKIFKEQQKEYHNHPQLRFNETTPIAIHRSAQSLVQWSDKGKLLVNFKKLSCKKAYFWGEENHAMPILGLLPGIKTYMIHRSGHGMMTDNPDEFYATLAEFIDS